MSRERIGVSFVSVAAVLLFAAAPAAAQPFELSVRKDRVFGASQGSLVFASDSVMFQTPDSKEAREWVYDDIKQVQILSSTHVRLATYEDRGWTRLGADRTVDFEVTGEPVSEALVVFLQTRVPHPLVTAVVPAVDADPLFRVPVKLRQRIHGSHGMLEVWGDRIVYRTPRDEHSRLWRLADLYLVFQPDRHRLTVQAYEGGGDQTRAFEFDLKRSLPPGALEAIWDGMHGSSADRVGRPD